MNMSDLREKHSFQNMYIMQFKMYIENNLSEQYKFGNFIE